MVVYQPGAGNHIIMYVVPYKLCFATMYLRCLEKLTSWTTLNENHMGKAYQRLTMFMASVNKRRYSCYRYIFQVTTYCKFVLNTPFLSCFGMFYMTIAVLLKMSQKYNFWNCCSHIMFAAVPRVRETHLTRIVVVVALSGNDK